jgi:phytoene/squalene synthetase
VTASERAARAAPTSRRPGNGDALQASYRRCERITRQHGTTYWWGARLLSRESRQHVHAVYALCRLADDVVDDLDSLQGTATTPATTVPQRRTALRTFRQRFEQDLARGRSDDPVLAAVVDTVLTCGIDPECFGRFFDAMEMDLDVAAYETFDDLCGYMEGSAAVIGEMMLPVLRPRDQAAFQPARSLGLAFQLTNFLRDVGEDLDRGRVYLPQADLRRFGADPWRREVDDAWRAAMAFEIARCRDLYRHADTGIPLLPPASARCVGTARELYARILDRIEEADYDVFSDRRRVPTWRKAALAAGVLVTGPPQRRRGPSAEGKPMRQPVQQTRRLPLPGKAAIPISLVPMPPRDRLTPTWQDARPSRIAESLKRAQDRPTGNWYVVGASRDVRAGRPFGANVAGMELVLWRTGDGSLAAGPGACPHLGAPLCDSEVLHGRVVCHWHGLALGVEGFPGWSPYPAHDDGVLAWVRLDALGGEPPTDAPVLPERPPLRGSIEAVMVKTGTCEPDDVIANRLDPWHGSWLHPYSFSHLTVDEAASDPDRLEVDVTFRLSRRWGVPVRAVFTTPDRRTIVMHITDGEGAGSVVETHATPVEPRPGGVPRTAVTEATIAYSPRQGFAVTTKAAPAIRPLMVLAARRLWADDLAYAERRYALRAKGEFPG